MPTIRSVSCSSPADLNGRDGITGFFTTTVEATVLAQDSRAHPGFLVKEIGAGRVIFFSDVNIIGPSGGSEGSGITTNNDRLLANLFTFRGDDGTAARGQHRRLALQQ